jgi:glycerol-3-phosphate dehydrogenase
LLPIYPNHRFGIEMMNIGLWIYDALALFRSPKLHKTYRGKKAKNKEPLLLQEEMNGAISYYDCFTDDSRLVIENVIAAKEAGADCRSHTAITKIIRRKSGRVSGVKIKDQLSGKVETLQTHSLVIAAGPWTDRVLSMVEGKKHKPLLKPTKGVHVVFPREQLPLKQAVTVLSPVDGRVMFAIPWRGRMVLGTTDTFFDGDPNEVHADKDDVEYLCKSGNYFFPSANFKPEDVISTWAGLRPLISEDADSASDVSREHQVNMGEDGVHWIAGGKLTTYRIMADEIIDRNVQWLKDHYPSLFDDHPLIKEKTKELPLPGAIGLASNDEDGVHALAKTFVSANMSEALANHLAFT